MDKTQWEDFRKKIEDMVTASGQRDDDVKSLSEKIKDLERKFLELVPKAMNDNAGIPIIKGIYWKNDDQVKRFNEFAKSVFVNDRDKRIFMDDREKAMNETTDSAGGYLVPQEFRAVLVRLIEVYGLIRRNAFIVPMNREELAMPKLTSGVTVYWPGEGNAITESQPVFAQLTLVAKKMAALVPVTSELMEDSTIAIANLISTLFAEAMAQEEDRVGLTGVTAGDPFDGILNDSGVQELVMDTGDTGFADLTADYLLDLTQKIPPSAQKGAKFVMHRTIFDVVRKLKTTTGAYIWQPPTLSAPGTIWGYPYELSDEMPALTDTAVSTEFVIFGNFRHFYLGDRKKMTLATSMHYKFNQDLIYLRALERISLAVAIGNAFAKLTTAAT